MVQSGRVMRIVVFVEHFPPFLGSDRSVYELARRTAENGTKVHFIATQPLRYLLGHRPRDWQYRNRWLKPPPDIHENISSKYLYVSPQIERLWKRYAPLALIFTLIIFILQSIRELVTFNPDVVVAAHASPLLGISSFVSAKLTLKPVVMGCPDWMTAYAAGLVEQKMSSFGPLVMQFLESRLYQWSGMVFTATSYLAKLVQGLGTPASRIVVIPNGVDTQFFTPEVDVSSLVSKYRFDNTCVILFSGHLEEWAGVNLILELAELLSEDAPESNILLVGSGISTTHLFEHLFRKNLGHIVTLAGMHPFEEMPKFTAMADIALCLFPDTPVSHAASPLKLFEYMGAGRAIVASRVAGTAEVIDDSVGILVEPESIKETLDAILKLYKNPELRKKLGDAARKLAVERYNWSELSKTFKAVCEASIR